jgi:hypothetical protein
MSSQSEADMCPHPIAHEEETISESGDEKDVVFEEFFIARLRIPPHAALKFQAQFHQLTPNAMAQLSNYFWALGSFGGIPTTNAFAKRYELHYQPMMVEVRKVVLDPQFGCINFHAKCHKSSGVKFITIAIKKKWSLGWKRV